MSSKLIAILSLAAAGVCQAQQPSLKDAYRGIFRIGAAINQSEFDGTDARAVSIVAGQFNTVTPENVLKWQLIHPRVDGYEFGPADRYVAFGEKYKMFIIGHNLVWHSQTPRWVFQDDKGEPLTRDALLQRMHDHISTVVGRYKGRIGGWDVVNEALDEDGSLRKSQWQKIIGDDYIVKAFQFAHEADPTAELYYNDYSLDNEPKRKGAIAIVKRIQAAGIPITAVGVQDHYTVDWPPASQQAAMIEDFGAVGVKVCVTELDVDVLPRNSTGHSADISANFGSTPGANPYTAGLPDAMQQELARKYAEIFDVLVKHRAVVSRVTFWGVTDSDSWLNGFPFRGRTNYPLLFDRKGEPKPAFFSVIDAAKGKK